MNKLLILILSLSMTITAFGQQENSFTNKTEAKNQMVNGMKEGKWIEYDDSDYKLTTDENAAYYRLSIYHEGKLSLCRQRVL